MKKTIFILLFFLSSPAVVGAAEFSINTPNGVEIPIEQLLFIEASFAGIKGGFSSDHVGVFKIEITSTSTTKESPVYPNSVYKVTVNGVLTYTEYTYNFHHAILESLTQFCVNEKRWPFPPEAVKDAPEMKLSQADKDAAYSAMLKFSYHHPDSELPWVTLRRAEVKRCGYRIYAKLSNGDQGYDSYGTIKNPVSLEEFMEQHQASVVKSAVYKALKNSI